LRNGSSQTIASMQSFRTSDPLCFSIKVNSASAIDYYYSFFYKRPATPKIYTLSLHDALPISHRRDEHQERDDLPVPAVRPGGQRDRKSTRLNSSHVAISYGVLCLKKKNPIRAETANTEPTFAPACIVMCRNIETEMRAAIVPT